MKKIYEKPVTVSCDLEQGAFPAAALAAGGMLAGYAVGRAVTNMSRATPVIKLKELRR